MTDGDRDDEWPRSAPLPKMFWSIVGGLLLVAAYFLLPRLFGPSPAISDNMHAETLRMEGRTDEAIVTFTRMIVKNEGFSSVYAGRGEAYRSKGDFERALADFDTALKMDPNHDTALRYRCQLWQSKGELDRAIADCEQSVRVKPRSDLHDLIAKILLDQNKVDLALEHLDASLKLWPDSVETLMTRGLLFLFKKDRPAQAAEDLAHAMKEAFSRREMPVIGEPPVVNGVQITDLMAYNHPFLPDGYYLLLWTHIARARNGQDDRDELAVASQKLIDHIKMKLVFEKFEDTRPEADRKSREPWPGAIFGLLIGRTTPETLALAVQAVPDAATRLRRQCDVDFYLGEYRLEKGDKDEGRKLLQSAAANCPAGARERGFAASELKRLGS